jgi:hypothetical protein
MLLTRVVAIKFISLFIIILVFLPVYGGAADFFNSNQLSPSAKTYLVLKDVNVREKPINKSNVVGRLRKNKRINSIGKAKGTKWVAVKKDGKNLGFVYGKALVPVIDGKFLGLISSTIIDLNESDRELWPCHYTIKFIGKVKVESSLQVTSDYNLAMECNYKNKKIKINATMFLTELPYLKRTVPIYQINVDLYDIPMGTEDMFSTTVLYHAVANKLVFDGVNKKGLGSGKRIKKKEATDVSTALKGAVAMAHQSWGPIVWSELARTQKN